MCLAKGAYGVVNVLRLPTACSLATLWKWKRLV
jgi:hypothetical protein